MKTKNPIERAWEIYCEQSIPLTVGEVELKRLKRAFDAGALSVFSCFDVIESGAVPHARIKRALERLRSAAEAIASAMDSEGKTFKN
jgi:hypothetical protein